MDLVDAELSDVCAEFKRRGVRLIILSLGLGDTGNLEVSGSVPVPEAQRLIIALGQDLASKPIGPGRAVKVKRKRGGKRSKRKPGGNGRTDSGNGRRKK